MPSNAFYRARPRPAPRRTRNRQRCRRSSTRYAKAAISYCPPRSAVDDQDQFFSSAIHLATTLSEMLFDDPPSGGPLNTVILTVLSPYTPLFCSGPGALKRLGSALETAAAGTYAVLRRPLSNAALQPVTDWRACMRVRPDSTIMAISMCSVRPAMPEEGSSVPPMTLPPAATHFFRNWPHNR